MTRDLFKEAYETGFDDVAAEERRKVTAALLKIREFIDKSYYGVNSKGEDYLQHIKRRCDILDTIDTSIKGLIR